MPVARKIAEFTQRSSWIRQMFEEGGRLCELHGPDKVFDFSIGNPNVEPPEEFQEVLEGLVRERTPGSHGYMSNAGYPEAREAVAKVVSRDTLTGEMNRLSWLPVSGATGYRIYRGTQNTVRADFQRLKDVASGVTSYTDDGADVIVGGNPPASNTSGLTMSPVQVEPGNLSIINFGRANIGDEPVAGSNCSIKNS